MTAITEASFAVRMRESSSSASAADCSVEGAAAPGGVLKASERILSSVRRENAASKTRVMTCVKRGDSIRSDVSSRRRRSGGAELSEGEVRGETGGEGIVVGVCGGGGEDEKGDVVETPDSRRTESS